MIRQYIQQISEWAEGHLRRLIGPLSPDKRVVVIVVMLILFGSLSIYMTVSSICNFGREKDRRLHIENIESLKLQPGGQRESMNQQNEYEYGRTEE